MEIPIEQIAERGWIELGDLEGFRQAIWTMVHGIVSMRALRPDVEWRDDLLDLSLEGLIRGWLTPKEKRAVHYERQNRAGTNQEQVS